MPGEHPRPVADGHEPRVKATGLSRCSVAGVVLAVASIAPYALLGVAETLGWAEPNTGCGLVVLALVGGMAGGGLWLLGLLAGGRRPPDQDGGVA